MFPWGETEMLWTEAVVELLRWRRRRRELSQGISALVSGAEAYLATHGRGPAPA